jgi:sugar phosphate isomerase/epimerase
MDAKPTEIRERLYISTVASDAAPLAREHGLGLELAEFCTAYNMDADFGIWDRRVRRQMAGISRFVFHAPFNELCPAAVDPMIAAVAKKRYAQAYALMRGYGIVAMTVHSGYMPVLYDADWFAERSASFWKEFLSDKPKDFKVYMENVFERDPSLLLDIAGKVGDGRFRLCLDVGHAATSGKASPMAEWVERTAPFLGHVHLHNNDGLNDTHSALGDGETDVAATIRAIAEAAPHAQFTIEASDGKASAEWLGANGFLP